jgi:hypothetical protein
LPVYALNWLGMQGFELLAPEELQLGKQLSIGREAQEDEERPFNLDEDEIYPNNGGCLHGADTIQILSFGKQVLNLSVVVVHRENMPL